jgi:hypothetical protein
MYCFHSLYDIMNVVFDSFIHSSSRRPSLDDTPSRSSTSESFDSSQSVNMCGFQLKEAWSRVHNILTVWLDFGCSESLQL